MAIAVEGSTTSYSSNGGTGFSHTTTSGTQVLYLLRANYFNFANLSTPTWNGTSMTNVVQSTDGSTQSASIWRLASPAVGTYSFSWTNGSSRPVAAAAINLSGVDSGTWETDTDFNSGGTGTSISVSTITCAATDLTLFMCGVQDPSQTITIANGWTGSTSIVGPLTVTDSNPDDYEYLGMYKFEANPTVSVTWDATSRSRAWCAASVKAAAGTEPSLFPLLGVG